MVHVHVFGCTFVNNYQFSLNFNCAQALFESFGLILNVTFLS